MSNANCIEWLKEPCTSCYSVRQIGENDRSTGVRTGQHSNCSRWEQCVKCTEGNIGHVCFSLFFGKDFSTTELKPPACWMDSVPDLYSQPGTTSPMKNTDTVYICRSECPWPLSAIWWPEENDVGWRMCSSLLDVEEVYHIVLLSRCQSLCRALERTRVAYWCCALSVKMFSHQWGIRYNQVWAPPQCTGSREQQNEPRVLGAKPNKEVYDMR